jgi:hypothetical protein
MVPYLKSARGNTVAVPASVEKSRNLRNAALTTCPKEAIRKSCGTTYLRTTPSLAVLALLPTGKSRDKAEQISLASYYHPSKTPLHQDDR